MAKRNEGNPFDSVETRCRGMLALSESGSARSISGLTAGLRDPAFPVAKMAAMGLRTRGRLAEALEGLLSDADATVRWRACALAWFFPLPEFVPRLIGAIGDQDRMVRVRAALALRSAGSNEAVRALTKAARGDDDRLAHYAAWVLRRAIRPKHPHLRALKGLRIPERPLLAEQYPRRAVDLETVADDARAFAQFVCTQRLPACRAPLIEKPPAVDGRRGSAYSSASGGELDHIDRFPGPVQRPTDFRVVCSDDGLYIHVRCRVRDEVELASDCAEYGGPVYEDNSVDVLLDPSGRGRAPYYMIGLNTDNVRRDTLVTYTGVAPADHREGRWRPEGLRTAVRVEKGCWCAEINLPFADLGLRPGRVNKLWRFNVTRHTRLTDTQEDTSWADMGWYNSHQPDRFGWLWVDAGDCVNADASAFEVEPIEIALGLAGWTTIRGRADGDRGELHCLSGGATVRLDRPIEQETFEIACEAQLRHHLLFEFADGPENRRMGWAAIWLNLVHEINVSQVVEWEVWDRPIPGYPWVFTEVFPPMTHSRWYRLAVRVLADRVQVLLDDAVHLECPKPCPASRHFAIALLGGGRVRKLHIRRL